MQFAIFIYNAAILHTLYCRLGEACSHIAALISCVIATVESREKAGIDSVTSQSCKWLPPARNVWCQNIMVYAGHNILKLFRLPQLKFVTSNLVIQLVAQMLMESHYCLSSQDSPFLKMNSNYS